MRVTPLLLLAVGCVESTKRVGEPIPAPTPITQGLTLSDLRERPIVGDLGKPLGVCCELEATIFRGSDLNTKGSEGRYLLRVINVDGTLLPNPILMNFEVPRFVRSKLANDDMALYEKVNGTPASELSADQIRALEANYVGKTVHVSAYEKGGFSGIPNVMPKDAPVWQDHGFYFETWLVVLVDRSN
jgi:hypothetical protein